MTGKPVTIRRVAVPLIPWQVFAADGCYLSGHGTEQEARQWAAGHGFTIQESRRV